MLAFYRDAPTCRLYNVLTADRWRRRSPASPPAATARARGRRGHRRHARATCCPACRSGRAHYIFTDLSPLFVNAARAEPGSRRRPSLPPPSTSSATRASRASTARPSTSSSRRTCCTRPPTSTRTLGHVRGLLAPGGAARAARDHAAPALARRRLRAHRRLVGVRRPRPHHALLDPPSGARCSARGLRARRCASASREAALPGAVGAPARAPVDAARARRAETWLVLADRGGVGEKVAERLRRRGDTCVVAAGRGSRSADRLPARRSRAWSHLRTPGHARRAQAGEALLAAQRLGYGTAADLLARRRSREALPACGACVLVTAGAQAIEDGRECAPPSRRRRCGASAGPAARAPRAAPAARRPARASRGPRRSTRSRARCRRSEREDEVALRGVRRARRPPGAPRARRGTACADAAPEPARGRPFRAEVGAAGALDTLAPARGRASRRPARRGRDRGEGGLAQLPRRHVRASTCCPRRPSRTAERRPARHRLRGHRRRGRRGRRPPSRPGDEVVAIGAGVPRPRTPCTRDLVVRQPADAVLRGGGGLPARVRHRALLARAARAPRGRRARADPRRDRRRRPGRDPVARASRRGDLRHRGQRRRSASTCAPSASSTSMDSRSLDFADEVLEAHGRPRASTSS